MAGACKDWSEAVTGHTFDSTWQLISNRDLRAETGDWFYSESPLGEKPAADIPTTADACEFLKKAIAKATSTVHIVSKFVHQK